MLFHGLFYKNKSFKCSFFSIFKENKLEIIIIFLNRCVICKTLVVMVLIVDKNIFRNIFWKEDYSMISGSVLQKRLILIPTCIVIER